MTTSTPSNPRHLVFLVEDASGGILLDTLLPRILGSQGQPHTWTIHAYKGIGKIPPGLRATGDPAKRILLDQLPRILRGFGHTPGIDAVVVVLDTDRRDCREFLSELKTLLDSCHPAPKTLFRLAIEEMEAWYFGDQTAIRNAYPKANSRFLNAYNQDEICDTWEKLADAIHPGGSKALLKVGWPAPGQAKCDWARKIGPHLDPDQNQSPSFQKLVVGIRRLIS